uniref:Ribosomal protein S13 n=1 Tax=Sphaerothecum destruens TaxID=42893 RepID=A0A6H2U284_9EUKA|nr:ribosomal protein S13 [Sphaerothecum destruens]QID02685.1 ribosomal protein S13 [Sphaerothecum destruens]
MYRKGDYFDKFKGVGINKVRLIKDELGLNRKFWDRDVVEREVLEYIDYFMLGRKDINEWLDMEISKNISKKVKIKSYQGIRYSKGYPIYCQNVRNNGIIAKKLNNIK